MSWKIYYGLKTTYSLHTLYSRLVNDVKPKMLELTAAKWEKIWLKEESSYGQSAVDWMTLTHKKEIGHFAKLDVSISLFPDTVGDCRETLAIAHHTFDEQFALIESCGLFESFPYWNNTDPPEEINEAEWDLRQDRWDAVLGESGRPADRGLNLNLCSHEELFSQLMRTHYSKASS